MMFHRAISKRAPTKVLCGIAAAFAALPLLAFIPGPTRNVFKNGTYGDIRLKYESTALKLDKPVVIRYSSGLAMSGDGGTLLRVMIISPSGKVLELSTNEIQRIEAASGLKDGVWWINDEGVEYISTKESLSRHKRMFGRW